MRGRKTSNPSATTLWRRKKRHEAIMAATIPGVPPMPSALKGRAAEMWPLVVGQLQRDGLLSTIDGAAIESCCRTWALFNDALALCEKNPADSDLAGNLNKYQKAFESWSARLCLTSVDRARVTAPTTAADSLDAFLATRPV